MTTTISVPVRLFRDTPAFEVAALSFMPVSPSTKLGDGTVAESYGGNVADADARWRLEASIAILQLVVPGPIEVDFTRAVVNRTQADGSGVGSASWGASTMIAALPYLEEQLRDVATAVVGIEASGPIERERIEQALRFYRMAQSARDTVQRFALAWIALEARYAADDDDEERDNTRGIHQAIERVYPGDMVSKVRKRIRAIYRLRGDLFHRANYRDQQLATAASETLEVLRYCLLRDVGLTPPPISLTLS